MKIKYYLKEKLPPFIFHILKVIYKQRALFHYWIPYVLGNGKALTPTRLSLEITYHCNQKCLMCPQAAEISHDDSLLLKKRKTLRELSTEEIFSLISDAKRMGIKEFGLTGGEPFIRKDVVDIIKFIKNSKLDCSVLSNGALITKDIAKEIVAAQLDRITFSLDGHEEIHDKIRNSKNAFSKLMQAVSYIKDEKERKKSNLPYISFSTTISAINSNYLAKLVDVAAQQDMDINFGYLFYTTKEMTEKTNKILRMENIKDEDQDVKDSLKKVDIKKLEEEIEKIKQKEKTLGIKATFQPPLKGEEIHLRFNDDSAAYATKCFLPWYKTIVNPYGNVYPCSMNILMGNIRDDSLSNIWNNDKYVNFRKSLKQNKLFPKCVKCCALTNKLWSYLPSF